MKLQKDTDAAILLKTFIETLDQNLFPDFPSHVKVKPGPYHHVASYIFPKSDTDNGLFTVYTKNICRHLRNENEIMSDILNKLFKDLPTSITMRHAPDIEIMALAAHEVRHKVQFFLTPKLFKQMPVKKYQNINILVDIRIASTKIFQFYRKEFKKQNYPPHLIKMYSGPDEFDATVVQLMTPQILHSMNDKSQFDTLISLILSGTKKTA